MHVIKLAIISFVFFFLLITGISLFIPSHIRISKIINIKASRDSVMSRVRDVEKWRDWYPGLDTVAALSFSKDAVMLNYSDPLKPTYIIIDRGKEREDTVIAEFINKGKEQTFMGWNCIENKEADSSGEAGSATLEWYMDFHLRWYPWEKFSSLLLEKRYGPTMEKGLDKLKSLAEK